MEIMLNEPILKNNQKNISLPSCVLSLSLSLFGTVIRVALSFVILKPLPMIYISFLNSLYRMLRPLFHHLPIFVSH